MTLFRYKPLCLDQGGVSLPSGYALRSNYVIKRPIRVNVRFRLDAAAITRGQIEVFDKNPILSVNCLDEAVEFKEVPKDLPFLCYRMLLGRVNFPDELPNRRMVLFPASEETKENCKSNNQA